MRILELFCGTKSIGKVFESHGWEVTSVDIDPKFKPTHVSDIMNWNYQQFQPSEFDVIWASPPCNTFSLLRGPLKTQLGWTQEKIEQDIQNIGLPILRKAQEIIEYLKPTFYFIENPQSGRMKEFLQGPHYDVDYCQYGFLYRKRTRIWTNLKSFEPKKCNHKGRHEQRIGASGDPGLRSRYSIPAPLIEDLFDALPIN